MSEAFEDDMFVNYEPEVAEETTAKDETTNKENTHKKGYVGIHSAGFRDFFLKPQLLQAIGDCGFEHPSEVQQQCIPDAITSMDIICQAKSGMGKTAVFVLSVLQQIEPENGKISCLVLCHTRELAYQICHEFSRFSKHFDGIRTAVFYGGVNIKSHRELLSSEVPHIVVGTPGRIKALVTEGSLNLKHIKYFVLDECDRMLEYLDMRSDVQEIFSYTPKNKQVMMFSATMGDDIKKVAKKFMVDPMEVYVDSEAKLTLHGLVQHYADLKEQQKNSKLAELLDNLEFNQVVIFVNSRRRASVLNNLLNEYNFPSICIHSKMDQEDRIEKYQQFKKFEKRILVATELFGRGIDIERVNIVINYDMAKDAFAYLHRVGRAGRFGTKGLAISFISSDDDKTVLQSVQDKFTVKVTALPKGQIPTTSYM